MELKAVLALVCFGAEVLLTGGIKWSDVHCSLDGEPNVPEGKVEDIGRFPWLGVVQHSFRMAGVERFAVTSGILIHRLHVIAPADDIAKIDVQECLNGTSFVVWENKQNKHVLGVKDYILHPEYEKGVTYATIALVNLLSYREGGSSSGDVLPVCLPLSGELVYEDLYEVTINDDKGEIVKYINSMKTVPGEICAEFYFRAELSDMQMTPVDPLCVTSSVTSVACVSDGGSALISRGSQGFWTILGFGTRGPGCGAPARFIPIYRHMMWIDDTISNLQYPELYTRRSGGADGHMFLYRRASPHKIVMLRASDELAVDIPSSTNNYGECEKDYRGVMLYRELSQIQTDRLTKARGVFYLQVSQIAEFRCAEITLKVAGDMEANLWLETTCRRDTLGDTEDPRRLECFVFYRTQASMEFRFEFVSFAKIEIILYGMEESKPQIPDPILTNNEPITTSWLQAGVGKIRWRYYVPINVWFYIL